MNQHRRNTSVQKNGIDVHALSTFIKTCSKKIVIFIFRAGALAFNGINLVYTPLGVWHKCAFTLDLIE